VGYTAVGKDGKSPRLHHHQSGKSMSRFIVLIIAVVLVIGGLILLSTQAKEVPTRMIETDVSQGAH
jgi:cytochrome b subunit of formate dehydrogenase